MTRCRPGAPASGISRRFAAGLNLATAAAVSVFAFAMLASRRARWFQLGAVVVALMNFHGGADFRPRRIRRQADRQSGSKQREDHARQKLVHSLALPVGPRGNVRVTAWSGYTPLPLVINLP